MWWLKFKAKLRGKVFCEDCYGYIRSCPTSEFCQNIRLRKFVDTPDKRVFLAPDLKRADLNKDNNCPYFYPAADCYY